MQLTVIIYTNVAFLIGKRCISTINAEYLDIGMEFFPTFFLFL